MLQPLTDADKAAGKDGPALLMRYPTTMQQTCGPTCQKAKGSLLGFTSAGVCHEQGTVVLQKYFLDLLLGLLVHNCKGRAEMREAGVR